MKPKKILFAVAALVALVAAFTLSVSAAAEAETKPTVFSRVWEYVAENRDAVVAYLADGAVLAIALLVSRRAKALAVKLFGALSSSATESTQTELVAAFNALVEERNADAATVAEQGEELRALARELAAARRELEAVRAQTKATLDALFNVWGNSKNLPNGIKDLLAAIYAEGTRKAGAESEVARDEAGSPS